MRAADDLVQDCLERAVSRWHQRRHGNVRAWLFTILHNLAVNRFRQAAVARRACPDRGAANEGRVRRAAAQEHRLMYQDVLNKLAKLPEEQRAVLLLVAVEDLSYAEAAKVFNVPVGTVMSRLSRARERLQQEIDGVRYARERGVNAEPEMNRRPITEDDLHAYVDDVLEPERRAESRLLSARSSGCRQARRRLCRSARLLRAALAPIAESRCRPS